MIRRAVPGDAQHAHALELRNLGRDAWPYGIVAHGVGGEVPTTTWLVADEGGMLVGHAVLSVAGDVAELQRISVDQDRRRTGVASTLLAQVEALAAAAGAERVLLEVREDNEGARSFYVARGYALLDRRPRYYADGAAAVVMVKHLPDVTPAAAPA